jgi:arabinogalactan endo-1,4-beta-galactosidase
MYPYSDEGQLNFTEDMIRTLNRHDSVTGLFWWFMEADECGLDWNTQRVTDKWYNAPLFDNRDGRATSALSALKNFLPSSGISDVNAAKGDADSRIFTIDGRLVGTDGDAKQLPAGLYVSAGKKIAVR